MRKKKDDPKLTVHSSVIHSNSLIWPVDNSFEEAGRAGGKNPFKGHSTLNRECSSVTSLSAWEIAVQNGNRRPAMARMVNRVSYLLPKQMVSQNERKKSTHIHILPPKCKRICQIKHEHESHSSSEKSYLCSFCYLSNVTELPQRPRVLASKREQE